MGRRGWIGAGIVVFWLVMIGALMQREWGGTWVKAPVDTESLQESSSTWLGLFVIDGPQVGYVHLRRSPEERHDQSGIRFTMSSRMALSLLGRDTDMTIGGTFWRSVDEPLAELALTVDSMGQTMELAGEVRDGALKGQVLSGGETIPLEFPMDPEMLLQTGFGAATQFPPMDVGDDFRMESFDPLTLKKAPARVRCVAKEVMEVGGVGLETRVLEVTTGGFTSKAWVDEQGEVVRAETPFGLMLQRLSPEKASAMAGGQYAPAGAGEAGGDLLGLTAIRPTGEQPRRGLSELTLRVSGLDAGVEIPLDGFQSLTPNGELRIVQQNEPLPETLSEAGALPEATATELLAADAFVQSEHPKIIAQAKSIVGDETDPKRQALLLHDWVYENLEKVPVMSIPSALEVLSGLKGDCNEHTVLYTALARSLGLPTAIAIGVVWSDDLGGFYYHAWPEVWVGDGFQRLDPTLDQPAADATHVKFLQGGIESWPRLLAFLGRIEFHVIETKDSEA